MTQEEATVLVEGLIRRLDGSGHHADADALKTLFFHMGKKAAAEVAAEREACALEAERARSLPSRGGSLYPLDWLHQAIAAAIRDRGKSGA